MVERLIEEKESNRRSFDSASLKMTIAVRLWAVE